jgi:heme-degrading monooxygenase HmoA
MFLRKRRDAMAELYTFGAWKPSAGKEQAFVDAWLEFAGWASGRPGAGKLRLARDVRQPERFVSFGPWDTPDAVRDWKSAPEFRERLSHVRQHADEFVPTEFTVVATADSGVSAVDPSPFETEPIHAPQ